MANTGKRNQRRLYEGPHADPMSAYRSDDFRVLLSRYSGYAAFSIALLVIGYAAIELLIG